LLARTRPSLSHGSLSNEDGDDNENGNKPIGLDWQNNNLARGSHFLVHSFADYDAKMLIKFHVLSRTGTQNNTNFPFLFLNFDTTFKNLAPKKFATFDELNEME